MLTSALLPRGGSRLVAAATRRGNLSKRSVLRTFASGDGGDKDDKDKTSSEDDPFGLNFEDSNLAEGSVNIGPKSSLPPKYKRDVVTGKFTNEVETELSEEVTKLLNLGPLTKERRLTGTFQKALESKDGEEEGFGLNESLEHVAERIREEELAMNTLGRRVSDLQTSDSVDASSAPLTDNELRSLRKYIKKKAGAAHGDISQPTKRLVEDVGDLIPIASQHSAKSSAEYEFDPENPDMDLKWTTPSAHRAMQDLDDSNIDDPFVTLLPSDLVVSSKVNRKRAKPIPPKLLHHNNVQLLRRYVTPGGQIMNRVQSRLGAKDQRKVAKLIKRARHLGLIPFLGQWKVEDHGNVKEKDLLEEREWEQQLIERGIVERKALKTVKADTSRSMW